MGATHSQSSCTGAHLSDLERARTRKRIEQQVERDQETEFRRRRDSRREKGNIQVVYISYSFDSFGIPSLFGQRLNQEKVKAAEEWERC